MDAAATARNIDRSDTYMKKSKKNGKEENNEEVADVLGYERNRYLLANHFFKKIGHNNRIASLS